MEILSIDVDDLANMADPFGRGLDLLAFRGRGYDEMLQPV